MRKILLLFCMALLFPACVNITPGGDTSDTTKLMLEILNKNKRTETPSVVKVDSATLVSMSPEQIKALASLAKVGKEAAIHAPKNTSTDSSSTGIDSETEHTEKESMLMKSIASLIGLIVIFGLIFVWKWFGSTPLGQLLRKGGAAGIALASDAVDYLEEEIEEIIEKQRDTHDPMELQKLRERENLLRRKQAKRK